MHRRGATPGCATRRRRDLSSYEIMQKKTIRLLDSILTKTINNSSFELTINNYCNVKTIDSHDDPLVISFMLK